MTGKLKTESFSQHIFEVRYKPNSRVLDYRGVWAEEISGLMDFPEWRILENRIDIFDNKAKNRAFVGFQNAGFLSHDVPTSNFFPDHVRKFMKFLLNMDGFQNPLFVNRIGIRSKFYNAFAGTFEELRNRYSTRYLTLTAEASKIMNAQLVDIGAPLNFADKDGNFNTLSGPMSAEQAEQLLERQMDLPDIGLYCDIDYWRKPEETLDERNILDLIAKFARKAWGKNEDICRLIISD